MYTTPASRPRRAPSTATLRFLCQLAYISSGTALGVGALCAEERRRRTQIVQHIADNARRIRQSPRYYSNAAVAAGQAGAVGEDVGVAYWGGDGSGSGNVEEEWGRRRRKDGEEDIRGPGLPSVVDGEYERVVRLEHKRKRRRGGEKEDTVVGSSGSAQRISHTTPSPEVRRPVTVQRSDNPVHCPSRRTGASHVAADFRQYQARREQKPGEETATTVHPLLRIRPLCHTTRNRSQYSKIPDSDLATLFRTRVLWRKFEHPIIVNPSSISELRMTRDPQLATQHLSGDIEQFFLHVSGAPGPKLSLTDAEPIARELLWLALDCGSLEDIRSLFLWRLAIKRLTNQDFLAICRAAPKLASRQNWTDVSEFYLSIMATKAFQELGDVVKLRCGLDLFLENLKWRNDVETLVPSWRFTIPTFESKGKNSNFFPTIIQACKRLLQEGHVVAAAKLLREAEIRSGTFGGLNELTDKCFAAALEGGHLSTCARLLGRIRKAPSPNNWSKVVKFFHACSKAQAYGLLFAVVNNILRGGYDTQLTVDRLRDSLGDDGLVAACVAYAEGGGSPHEFSLLWKHVPLERREEVMNASAKSELAALKANWAATRNVESAERRHQIIKQRAVEGARSGTAQRSIDLAMAEIYLSANRLNSAAKLLSKANSGVNDHTAIMLAALTFAKQGNWVSFHRLFDLLGSHEMPPTWTSATRRVFNNVLHLFSLRHDVQQTFQLAKLAIQKIGLVPNKATSEVMMQSFVSKRLLSWIGPWRDLLSAKGFVFELDEQIAATMMKRFYLDQRPAHSIMMWFCRTVARYVPSSSTGALANVVRDAIAYDLRHIGGQNAPWQIENARIRKQLLESANGAIPRPGYVLNGVLYDQGQPIDVGNQNVPNGGDDTASTRPLTAPGEGEEHMQRLLEEYNAAETDDVTATSGPAHEDHTSMSDQTGDITLSEADDTQTLQQFSASEPSATLERAMILALSLGDFERVLYMCHHNLDSAGLPASPRALEVAVQASIRMKNGDTAQAENLMAAAKDAGMNVTCATGPLLIQEMRQHGFGTSQDANRLRSMVLDYYRTNRENGWHVKHHVGIVAAHRFCQAGHPHMAIELLTNILKSDAANERPLDVVAMTVWFRSYAATHSYKGMRWAVKSVYDQNMRIDQDFLDTLKRSRRALVKAVAPNTTAMARSVHAWHTLFLQRRREQRHAAYQFGKKLVHRIALNASEEYRTEFKRKYVHWRSRVLGRRKPPSSTARELPRARRGRLAKHVQEPALTVEPTKSV